MHFSDEFLKRIPDNPERAVVNAIESARRDTEGEDLAFSYNIYTEALCLIQAIESQFFPPPMDRPELTGDFESDFQFIENCFADYLRVYKPSVEAHRLDEISNYFSQALGGTFCYEFSTGDIERIQTLINELRHHLAELGDIEDEHRQRLMRRLEKLQSELHKRMSDVDRFWGLVGDAGIALGKFGEAAKPIVNRIREIADIVWRTQARSEGLPSNTEQPLRIGSEEGGDLPVEDAGER